MKVRSLARFPLWVDPLSYAGLRAQRLLSHRVKVGFGPIRTRTNTLGTRVWHIDPIVEWINAHSDTYVCDAFLDHTRLRSYDLIVFVKYIDPLLAASADRLRREGKILLYRATDALLDSAKKEARYEEAVSKVDGLLLSSPLQATPLSAPLTRLISSPVVNTRYKASYASGRAVTLIWQGYLGNLYTMERFSHLVAGLAAALGVELKLIYHTNLPTRREGIVQYVKWKIEEWEEMLVRSDIAVAVKPRDDPSQQRKPPTKVLSYMAAGLPVVCTPSEADRAVILHGETGLFAHHDKEWREALGQLITHPEERERLGAAGRAYALEHHSVGRIASQHVEVFDALRGRGAG